MSAPDDAHALSLLVENDDAYGAITCRIKIDGKTVSEARARGVCHIETDGLGVEQLGS
jgi:hypothetical protein